MAMRKKRKKQKRSSQRHQPLSSKKQDHGCLMRIVFHEAGHAVAGVVLNRGFIRVSLEDTTEELPDGRTAIYTEGLVKSVEARRAGRRQRKAGLLDVSRLVVGMAGPEAEARYVGAVDDECNTGAATDFLHSALAIFCALHRTEAESRTEFTSHELHNSGPLVKAVFRGAHAEAEELIENWWPAIEATARALDESGHLSFDEVKEIVGRFS